MTRTVRLREEADRDLVAGIMVRTDMSKQSKFPPGWDEERVRGVLKHYESQSEEEAVAEDEAALDTSLATVMNVPKELVPQVRELIARHTKNA